MKTVGERAQSGVIGNVLILGFVLTAAATIVVIGGAAFVDTKADAQMQSAEQAVSQISAGGSQVGLGGSPRQQFRLDGADGTVSFRPNAGSVRVYHDYGSGETEILNASFGSLVYSVGDEEVAYQGGGVWRGDADGGVMVSPPEYHYRGRTLTFPLVRMTGQPWSDSGTVRGTMGDNGTEIVFPDGGLGNPLDNGTVYVEVQSDYHDGWATFFASRAEGNVQHFPDNRTVVADLTVPFEETFDHAVAATTIGGIDEGAVEGPTIDGVDRPSPSSEIEARIDDCETGSCASLDGTVENEVIKNGVHYADESVTIDSGTTFDTSDGDIDIVVDGDLTLKGQGGPHSVDQEITGGGTVTVYVNGTLDATGNPLTNTNGNPSDLLVLIHTNQSNTLSFSGTAQFTGAVYAPGSTIEINGGGAVDDNIVGGVVAESFEADGNGKLAYEPMTHELELNNTENQITFLHVSENRIDIERAD
ncbi:hypothetical protein KY092_01705 [Natronomonas gomsonensis]|uniref:DUF7289 family protein n=1 Tax=Natronomonas gomsonensis TaxID=1046043 RepID=UPI0020CA803B|nr:archaellin/type IV pilin N-terminal domain-containing protein [Natronomonas gomsonensis]MCY4729268.1 hypothetical protein [Natronomonas gomsonensis]